jgi:hypothetical protein
MSKKRSHRPTMTTIDYVKFPLCAYFLSGYLSQREDETNFPSNETPALFQRYEDIFRAGLSNLNLTREALKKRSEFNFDSGDAANLEGGIAILRVTEALRLKGFSEIALVSPKKGEQGADIVCDKRGIRVCLEVKAITKQSGGHKDVFMEDQLYEKARENATKAASQLKTSATVLKCKVTVLAYVVNWHPHSIHLTNSDLQQVVNKLAKDGDVESLQGIDGVWFIMKMGNEHLFLNENGKHIDD